MRSLVILALVATLGTACTKKNEDQGHAGAGPNFPIDPRDQNGGYPNYPGGGGPNYPGRGGPNNGGQGQLPDSFSVKSLRVGSSTLETVKTTPGTNRDDLERIRISCADSRSDNRTTSTDGIVMIEGSDLALIGNQSYKKPHTLISCNDGRRHDDRRSLNGRNDRRLQVGGQAVIVVKSSRNSMRRAELISVVVTCVSHPQQGLNQGRTGISLLQGSKIMASRDFRSQTTISCN